MVVRPDSPLFIRLREVTARGTQSLLDAGLLDSELQGPRAEEIEVLLKPYLRSGQQSAPGDESLRGIILSAAECGTAYQALGNADIAASWHRVGQYGWIGKAHWHDDPSALLWPDREEPAHRQEVAGICAAMAGNTSRAEELLTWAAANWRKTDLEIQSLEKDHDYQGIWQSLGFELFCRMWLGGQWDLIRDLSVLGMRVVEKAKKAGHPKDFREPQLLIETGWHLSAYFLEPSESSKRSAADSLSLEKIPDRDTTTRFNILMYLFALARRHPELSPYPDDIFHKSLWRPSVGHRDVPPTEEEFQSRLNEMFREAERKKKHQIRVSSVDLHLRVGGYPSLNHRLALCCEVMLRNQTGLDGMMALPSGPKEQARLEITYRIPRSR